MSGIAGSEFLLICIIGLLILGPERLPRVARQIGTWLGKARQMTRALRRQLEEEVDLEKNLGFNPDELHPDALLKPREDDTYSPLHDEDKDEDKDENENENDDEGAEPGAENPAAAEEKPAG